MKLKDLLNGVEIIKIINNIDNNIDITGIAYDSRMTEPGNIFIAIKGYASDGHKYINQAIEKGAAAILCEDMPENINNNIIYIQAENTRRGLAITSANWFGRPADDMIMIGVTGTNGKTSSAFLIKYILDAQKGNKVGLIGTNQNMIGDEILETERTTPESYELQKLFARMRDAGCTHVVMEVSSHALYLDRVYGVKYKIGVFTNLTQDHLDFHGNMENYCDAKAILFQNCEIGVCNADDEWTEYLLKNASCDIIYYGIKNNKNINKNIKPDIWAENINLSSDFVEYTAVLDNNIKNKLNNLNNIHNLNNINIKIGIPGGFMVYNSLDVLSTGIALGIAPRDCADALKTVPHVKGRVEVVPTPGKDYRILIDYAHTPDGLENVLKSVKGFAKGRTVALFGCGGDRDKTKRPKMGKIAAEIADFVIVTTDNPRTEKPGDIIQDIMPGMKDFDTPYKIIEDRVEAIHWAMDNAKPDDIIVLCGKGHETYQEINHVKYHMDEREIVADYL